MLLRDSEAPRGFQGRRDGRFTQPVWLADVAAINLGVLTESFRGTAFGVLMVPAVLPSRPTRRRTRAKAPCHRSDTLDKVAKPDSSLGGPDGSTGPGNTLAARRRVYVLRTPHTPSESGEERMKLRQSWIIVCLLANLEALGILSTVAMMEKTEM